MSIEALGHVFALRLPAVEKLLLIYLANHADPYGDSIFPALDTLEQETGLARSTLKRAFKELLKRELIERVAESTPVSPAWYRVVDVPAPREPLKQPSCPAVLRRAVILAFESTCEYCKRPSASRDLDPDSKPWHIDRVVPGLRGGVYTPDNVTLSCRVCNIRKKANPAPDGTRTFADLQREQRVQSEPSLFQGVRGDSEPPEGVSVDAGTVQVGRREGLPANPEPTIDPSIEPSLKEQAGAAPLVFAQSSNPDENLSVITKLAHLSIDVLGQHSLSDLKADVVQRCIDEQIAWSPDVVRKAIDSAIWQRKNRRRA